MTTLDFSLGLWYYSMFVKIHFYLIRAFILSNMILLNFVTGYMYLTHINALIQQCYIMLMNILEN